jgi:hypothetical protein
MPTKITYNGKTTELGAKCIATLSCKDYTMATDVVIEAPQSEGAKLYGIKVTPTKEIQNIVPEDNYDGFDEVIVNPIPDEYEIVEEWDGSGVVIEAIATEDAEDEIVGTWVFNNGVADDLSTITPNTFGFNFTSNGNSYTSIVTQYGGEFGVAQMYYDSTLAYGGNTDTSWQNEAYKTINITSEPTDAAFITWLKANATKQGATSLISFTIDGTSYQAEENMEWRDWCLSEYNTGGYLDGANNSNYDAGKSSIWAPDLSTRVGTTTSQAVDHKDVITEYAYVHITASSGGTGGTGGAD